MKKRVALLIAVLAVAGASLGVAYAGSTKSAHPNAASRSLAAAPIWGVINADGTIARQSGWITSVNHDATGHYDIYLNKDPGVCAVSGMTGDNHLGATSGSAFTMGYAWEAPDRLDIHIYDARAGGETNNDFSFEVAQCSGSSPGSGSQPPPPPAPPLG